MQIETVSRLTGITKATLRMWERRYRFLDKIERGDRNQRIYTLRDVECLKKIGYLVRQSGYRLQVFNDKSFEEIEQIYDASLKAYKNMGAEGLEEAVVRLANHYGFYVDMKLFRQSIGVSVAENNVE